MVGAMLVMAGHTTTWSRRNFYLRTGVDRLQGRHWSSHSLSIRSPKILGIHFARGDFVHSLVAIVQNVPHTPLTSTGEDAPMF